MSVQPYMPPSGPVGAHTDSCVTGPDVGVSRTHSHPAGQGLDDVVHADSRALDRLLDVDALADLLCMDRRGVYRLRAAGKLPPPISLGTRLRWRASTITAWLDSLEQS